MPKPTTSLLFLLPFITICFISCSGKNKNDEKVIEALQKSLISSSYNINISTETILKDLEEKTQDICTKERAEKWFTKAQAIVRISKKLYDLLESTKSKKEIQDHELSLIINKTKEFNTEILLLHEELQEVFGDSFQFINTFISAIGGDTLEKDKSFKKITTSSKIAILSMLQNEVKKMENKTISFCHIKVPQCGGWFDSYAVIVGQNSNYLKPASKLEIMTGVGAFSKAAQPDITINNKKMDLGPEGYSIYKMRVPEDPGSYTVPVRIKYVDKYSGKEEERTINVKYTVAKECDQ